MASDAARPRANPRGFSPLTQQKRRSAKPLCRFWRKVRDYLRRHENKMEMTGRRLDGFGRCASSHEPAGVLTLTQQKRRSAKSLCRFWRKVRDYLRRHENKMEMTGRQLDGFGRCASSHEPAGVLTPHTAKTAERKIALPFLAERL